MEEVAQFLYGEYGINQPGKSISMAASKSSPAKTLISFDSIDGLQEEKNALSSSKKDRVLESLGLGLKQTEGLGFDELVIGNKVTDDPFLAFEIGFPSLHQSNVVSSADVDKRDDFDFSDFVGGANSLFGSGGSGNIEKFSSFSSVQIASNVQKFIVEEPLQSSSVSGENYEFFSIYENGTDEKEMEATLAKDDDNSYNGIEVFFSDMGLGGGIPPKKMEASSKTVFDAPFELRGGSGGAQRVPKVSNFNIKESSFMKIRPDDLSFGMGAFQSPSEFQDGDNERRRRARYERERRKIEKAEAALYEKIEHDYELQREKKEREMISEELDVEIKQWAAGKEGNLRALISTLQDVLWTECDWKPISLGNLMTSVAVKKAYGKAALCIHPDKVQQKGATIRQKYVAEKVFYLLTEALNKFSSQEL